MKKLIISIILTFIFVSNYAEDLNVKGVIFYIHFSAPNIHTNTYTFKLIDNNSEVKTKSIFVLKRELLKYPIIILRNYLPKNIYVVNDCFNIKSKQHINGLSNIDLIIIRYKVLNLKYYTEVLHHEIFHAIIANTNINIVHKLLKNRLDSICNYNNTTSDYNYTQFLADFITDYHPNFEETSCEMFALLMYNDLNYKNNISIPTWLIRYNNNYKLKKKFKILIDFTKYISNNKMDLNFYYTINN